jgi:hypothetical protein
MRGVLEDGLGLAAKNYRLCKALTFKEHVAIADFFVHFFKNPYHPPID